jgi:hypothetical protein
VDPVWCARRVFALSRNAERQGVVDGVISRQLRSLTRSADSQFMLSPTNASYFIAGHSSRVNVRVGYGFPWFSRWQPILQAAAFAQESGRSTPPQIHDSWQAFGRLHVELCPWRAQIPTRLRRLCRHRPCGTPVQAPRRTTVSRHPTLLDLSALDRHRSGFKSQVVVPVSFQASGILAGMTT